MFQTALDLLRSFIDAHGRHKALWGSDLPGTLTSATYRQMIDSVEKNQLFTNEEKDCIFFLNAVKAYY